MAAGLSFGALLCVVPNLGSSSPVGVILLSLLCTVRLSSFFLLPLWQQIPTTAAIRWVADGQNQSTPDTFYQGGLDALSGLFFFHDIHLEVVWRISGGLRAGLACLIVLAVRRWCLDSHCLYEGVLFYRQSF